MRTCIATPEPLYVLHIMSCHVTDQPTAISMLQLTALWQSISRHVFDEDDSTESAQLQADGVHVDVPVKRSFQDIGKNEYYQLLHYTTVNACTAEPQKKSS